MTTDHTGSLSLGTCLALWGLFR